MAMSCVGKHKFLYFMQLFVEVFNDSGRWVGAHARGSKLIWKNTPRPSCHTRR